MSDVNADKIPVPAQPEVLLHCLMDIAEALLAVGAEVNRVEDTLTRMGTAYGAVRMNAFVITSSIVVTMTLPSGRDITQTRRILTPGGTDFTVLEALNDLSRRCCADPIPLDELRREVAQITAEAPKPLLVYLGSALAAGSCALFFGGSMTDGLVAALFGLVICRLQRHFGPQCPNRLVFNLLSALAVGISITLCAFFLPELHADKILIGDIMLLIPGLAMTNAVRDTMVGSPISGAMRLIETLLWAGALAMGFMSAFFDGRDRTVIVQLLTSFTGALGFCLVFHLRQRYMFAASLGGLLTCGVYLAAASIWSGILLPTLTAAAFAALYAEFLAWFMGAPATLFLIPALLIPLVPGRPLYYAMYYAVQQDMDLSADFARQTALYALGIALGASLVWALADMRRHLKQNGFGN